MVIIFANLDFEEELACEGSYRISPKLAATSHLWRYLLRLLPNAQTSECWEPTSSMDKLDRPTPKAFHFWGVTPTVLELGSRLGLSSHLPDLSAVRLVNSKLFSHQIEHDLGVALPYSRLVSTLPELEQSVSECPHDWVLKHPLGFSGRERAVGKASRISDSALGWARKRLQAGWTLLFEPWLEEKVEWSFHFDLTISGEIIDCGFTELRSDAGGVYRGNMVDPNSEPEPAHLQVAREVARKVSEEGYWGPLGIDTMLGRLGEEVFYRPLTEINARTSFGRMTLELARHLPANFCYSWWHPRRADLPKVPRAPELHSACSEGVFRLPEWADPDHGSRTLVLVSPKASGIPAMEQQLAEL